MNDLERDLRQVLDEDARRVPTPTSAPEGLRRSARRRQVVFGGAVALAGLAVVAGIVAGATTLVSLRSGPEPAAQGPTTTRHDERHHDHLSGGVAPDRPRRSRAERVPDDGRVAAPPHRARAGADAGSRDLRLPRSGHRRRCRPAAHDDPGGAARDRWPICRTLAGPSRADERRRVRLGLLPGVGVPARRVGRHPAGRSRLGSGSPRRRATRSATACSRRSPR